MQVLLHPRCSPPDTVRVWIGARPFTSAPVLNWLLDGAPVAPVAVRPLQSARPDPLLAGNPPRVFTGVFEFTGLQPNKLHLVKVAIATPSGLISHSIQVRTLPKELPSGTDDWLNILLVSCYHYATSPREILAGVMFDIQKECKPSLSLLLGDQVYLDLPTIKDFPENRVPLAQRFEVDYARNWFEPGGYRDVLAQAPSVSIADDHEYWNNYPHASPIIQNSWTARGRAEWTVAARTLFDAFQGPYPTPAGDEVVIDLDPISIFVADTRTFRQDDRSASMTPNSIANLGAWITGLNVNRKIGIFVSGQSIFDEAAGAVSGTVGDTTLANYGDFPTLVGHLSRAQSPLICITGDVHWGRVSQVRDRFDSGRLAMYEIITSPTSLVQSVGIDQVRTVGGFLRGIFGVEQPWPKHSEPSLEPAWQGSPRGRFECTVRHGRRGDQVAVLSLRKFGAGVQAKVGFFSLHSDPQHRTRTWSQPFDLARGLAQPF